MTAADPSTTGRDLVQLRIQLSTLLAAAEDLAEEWEATLELADHLRSQRQHSGQDTGTAAVLADLEALMRASAAFPTTPHRCRTVAELLPAIAKAARAYEQLLRQHLDHARHHLDTRTRSVREP